MGRVAYPQLAVLIHGVDVVLPEDVLEPVGTVDFPWEAAPPSRCISFSSLTVMTDTYHPRPRVQRPLRPGSGNAHPLGTTLWDSMGCSGVPLCCTGAVQASYTPGAASDTVRSPGPHLEKHLDKPMLCRLKCKYAGGWSNGKTADSDRYSRFDS